MLWLVTVEGHDRATDILDRRYDAIVLAHSERGARSAATRAVKRLGHGLVEVASTSAVALSVQETGTVLVTYHLEDPIFVKEAPHE